MEFDLNKKAAGSLKKILMVAPQPFFSPRGTPFSVLYRLHALSRLGYQVDLVTYPMGEDVALKNVSIQRTPKIPFIKKVAIGPSKEKILLDFFVFWKTLRLLSTRHYDVLHSHEEAGFFCTWLSKWFRVKHLYDMHSSLPQQLHNFEFTRSKRLVACFEWLEKKTLRHAHAVITICPALFDYVHALFPDKRQVMIENVLDNSWVLEPAKETVSSVQRRYGIHGRPNILYTGTFEPYQGLGLLIESARYVLQSHPDALFVLVGGHPEQVAEHQQRVNAMGMGDRFIFTGQVWPNVVPLFIELADILVSPRIQGNNTPLKIYSYLRSGKPVVATDHPTHTQVLHDNIALLTEPTPEAFASGIINLIENRKLYDKISSNALEVAKARYSFESYLSKIQAIYEGL